MTEQISLATAIGRQVRAALAELGKSQTDLALGTGVTLTHLSRRINGRVSFRADELFEIAEYLEVDIARFYRRMPSPQQRLPPAPNAPVPHQRGQARPAGTRGAA